MKQAFLSLILAIVLLASFSSAAVTVNDVTITAQPGETKAAQFTFESTTNIDTIQITLKEDLKGTVPTRIIPKGDITFNPNDIGNATPGEEKIIGVSVLVRPSVQFDNYTGIINVSYFESGILKSETSTIKVIVKTDEVTGNSIIMNDVTFGSDTQSREERISKVVKITNNGNTDFTGLVLSSNIDSKFQVQYTQVPTTLNAGQSVDVSVSLILPLDTDANLGEIGILTLSTDQNYVKTSKIFAEAENYLSIDELRVYITHANGDEWDDELDDGDDASEEVKPGDTIRIEIDVDNDNSDDIDFNDVEVAIDNDDELDVNDDDEKDIDEGRSGTFEFEFDVDTNVDEGVQDLIITVDGTDDEGARHTIEWTITFDIEKPNEELLITNIDISPSIVSCTSNLRVTVDIENTGSRDLSDAMVELSIDGLGIKKFERNIEIDESDDDEVVFSIDLGNARPGSYFVDITTYHGRSDNDDSDFSTEEFTIQTCGNTDNTPRPDVDDTDDTQQPTVDVNPGTVNVNGGSTPTGNVIQSVGKPSFFESTGYLALLTGLVVILIVVITVLLLTKKN